MKEDRFPFFDPFLKIELTLSLFPCRRTDGADIRKHGQLSV